METNGRVYFFVKHAVPGISLRPEAESLIEDADEPISTRAAIEVRTSDGTTREVRAADGCAVTRRDVFRALLSTHCEEGTREALHAVYYVPDKAGGKCMHHVITIPCEEPLA